MRSHIFTGLCLLALISCVFASGIPGDWDMGKMFKRATTSTTSVKTTSTTAKTSTTSAKTSTTSAKTSTTSAKTSASSTSTTSSASSSTSLVADSSCKNGPLTRACWSDGFSIATDFDQKHPTTQKTVSYNLAITNTTCNQDGHGDQQCLLINGQYPGPLITANWGDMVSITVTNKMQDNGTGIHWHGVRQLNSCGSDGVNGITECPIAPGHSKTYTFQATQFGTSWYHSHFSSQYGMGIVGPMIFYGPASGNYDVDLGAFPLTDWYYQNAWNVNDQTLAQLQLQQPPPAADTILINGTMNNGGSGKYAQVTVQKGKKHRLRLINTSVDNFIRVKLDNHLLTVIAADFIPTNPLPGQEWIMLAIGQRYDVIFTANQTSGTYVFRAEVAGDCLSANNGFGRALFTYSDASVSVPSTISAASNAPSNGCADLNVSPYWKQAIDGSDFTSQLKSFNLDLTQENYTSNGKNLVVWALNTTSMNVNWGAPTLEYIFNKSTSWPNYYDIVEIPDQGAMTYWLIQSLQTTLGPTQIAAPPPPHPIHLHGHDFFVLGQGPGTFSGSTSGLNFAAPPRRDTATLPGQGWLALAFPANNPGTWLMHCHIAWHISEGLGVQFLEAKDSIVLPSQTDFESNCQSWRQYEANMPYKKYDSGL